MRKPLIALLVIMLVSVAAVSYAHMRGGYGYGGGYGMMRGWDDVDQKTWDETYDLRKTLHDKKFEYREALRKGDEEKIEALEKELDKLGDEFYEKTGASGKDGEGRRGKAYGRRGYSGDGYGGPGGGYGNCGGPYGWR